MEYAFTHIGRREGLSQSNVTCITQDRKGFMWFGTRDGLNKYDGYTVTVYTNAEGEDRSLSHDYIRSLFEDSKGRLWVGTEDGLNLYNSATDDFTVFRQSRDDVHPGGNKIKAIYEDRDGNILLGSGHGLKIIREGSDTLLRYGDVNPLGKATDRQDIEDVIQNESGTIFLATWNNGLIEIHPHANMIRHYKSSRDPFSIGSNFLKRLFIDSDGTLWIGTTEGGLCRFDATKQSFVRFSSSSPKNKITNDDVLAIAEDSERNLWIGTQNGGINILDREGNAVSCMVPDEGDPDALSSGSVYAIYKDRDSNMWVGTFSGGVNLWLNNGRRFKLIDKRRGLNNNNVLCVYDDGEDVFIGTDGGGINLYSKRTGRFRRLRYLDSDPSGPLSDYPLCIYESANRELWIGSFYGKASVYDRKSDRFKHLRIDIDIDHVAAISEDMQGNVWLGTWGQGVIVYDRQRGSVRQYLPSSAPGSLAHNVVFAIFRDHAGNMWIGTEGGGLNLYLEKEDGFKAFKTDRQLQCSISNNIVNCIYEDDKHNLWIGTNGGLNKLDPRREEFVSYSIGKGLSSDVVQAIAEDANGNLWMSTNNGVSKFDPQTETFRNYSAADGLQNNSFNRLSFHQTKEGRIYFGGIGGLNYFHPDSITDNLTLPPVHITEFQVFNKVVRVRDKDSPLTRSIMETDHITLSYRQSVFSFGFSAINYWHPEKNQYAYKLDGFDQDWNYVGADRRATYTNLNPGRYVFRVKGSNNDGVWNEKGASIGITITPPLWLTWWAKLVYFFLCAALFVFLRRTLVERMKVRNRLEMDEMKFRFYANISHEFRTPLTLILGPINELKASLKPDQAESQTMLSLMQNNALRLLKLINQLMHIYELDAGFTKLKTGRSDIVMFCRTLTDAFQYLAHKRQIMYSFTADREAEVCYFDPDKLEKIVMNLLSNALKYTPEGGRVSVDVSIVDPGFADVPRSVRENKRKIHRIARISILDTGVGIAPHLHSSVFGRFFRVEHPSESREGTGIGLSLARLLALSHYGEITFQSEPGKGSTFTLWLPVNEDAFERHEIDQRVFEGQMKPDLQIADDIAGRPSSNGEPADDGRPLILIVDDSSDIRVYLRHNLASAFRIIEAENGAEGLKLAYETIPDVIISDVMMPEMDGLEMASSLKNDIRTSHIPLILLTARADEMFQLNAYERSLVNDYITKPFNAAVLLAKLRNTIDVRESQKRRLYAEFVGHPSSSALSTMDELFLKKAFAIVESHIDDTTFCVEKFSREVGMSQTNLYRKLQSLLGVSANQFIKNIRMKAAAELLASGNHSISEIAYRVGFADAKYFSQAFKKHFDMLPMEFANHSKTLAGAHQLDSTHPRKS